MSRERRNIGGRSTVYCQPTHNLINESGVHAISLLNITHQKCNVSIVKEVLVMMYERTIGRISPREHASRCPFPNSTWFNHLGSHILASGSWLGLTGNTLDTRRRFRLVWDYGIDRDNRGCF